MIKIIIFFISLNIIFSCTKHEKSGESAVSPFEEIKLSSYKDIAPLSTYYVITPSDSMGISKMTLNLGNDFSASNICTTYSIFGLSGTAACTNGGLPYLVSSNIYRDVGTPQMTMASEQKEDLDLPNGFRWIPKISKDDDGYDPSSPVIRATRPIVVCGTTDNTITKRINDCIEKNGTCSNVSYNSKSSCEAHSGLWTTTAYWNGETNGINGEASWKLVTHTGSKEVWQDQRTGFLWSDYVSSSINWCQASGSSNASGVDLKYREIDTTQSYSYCDNSTYQNQTHPISACFEDNGFVAHPDSGDLYSTTFGDGNSSYGAAKGFMGPNNKDTPRVYWRLPTRLDYEQANIDGIRFVFANLTHVNWSASVVSAESMRGYAWYLYGDGELGAFSRNSTSGHALCLGLYWGE